MMATMMPTLRERRRASAFDRVEPDGDDPLAEVMHEVGVALAADSLFVAWHERDADPVLLYTNGVTLADGVAEQAMEAACLAAEHGDSGAHSEWHSRDECSMGGELTTSIPASGGVVTITGRFDRLGAATRVRARETAGRLLPMVQPFVKLWAARRAVLSRVRGLTAAVNMSDVGILLVNRHGQLLFANDPAEALLATGDGIRRRGRILSGASLTDTLRLQAAIDHVITADEEPGRTGPTPVVALSRKSRRSLLAAVVGTQAQAGQAGQAGESAAIVYLCDPDQNLTALVEPACKLYGLSPVETRLACLLSGGISLTDAADAMHVREQTARSYLKQVFLKTETNRQAELVWLLLKSSVRTAPPPGMRLV